MNSSNLYILLAISAGIMIPFQSATNTQLGKTLQSPYFAALTVFIVAVIGLLIYIGTSRFSLPSSKQFLDTPWWSYAGGILGGTYVLLIVICAPKLGIGNLTILVLLGQIIAAIMIDHFGLLNTTPHTLNWQRTIGLTLMIIGVYLVKKF